jgi:hypothetical protein
MDWSAVPLSHGGSIGRQLARIAIKTDLNEIASLNKQARRYKAIASVIAWSA